MRQKKNLIVLICWIIFLSGCGNVSDVNSPKPVTEEKKNEAAGSIKIINTSVASISPSAAYTDLKTLKSRSASYAEKTGADSGLPIIGKIFQNEFISVSITSINAFPPTITYKIDFDKFDLGKISESSNLVSGSLVLDVSISESSTASLLINANTIEEEPLTINNTLKINFKNLSCLFNTKTLLIEPYSIENAVYINDSLIDSYLLKELFSEFPVSITEDSIYSSNQGETANSEEVSAPAINSLLTGDNAQKLLQQLLLIEYLTGNKTIPEGSIPAGLDLPSDFGDKLDAKTLISFLKLPEDGEFFSLNGLKFYLSDLSTNPNYIMIKAAFDNFKSGDTTFKSFTGNLYVKANLVDSNIQNSGMFLSLNTEHDSPLVINTEEKNDLNLEFKDFTVKITADEDSPYYVSGKILVNNIDMTQAPLSAILNQ